MDAPENDLFPTINALALWINIQRIVLVLAKESIILGLR